MGRDHAEAGSTAGANCPVGPRRIAGAAFWALLPQPIEDFATAGEAVAGPRCCGSMTSG